MSPKVTRKDHNPSKMTTRKQNIRQQRRIKNESILRISQMTQMLKSPINSKYDYDEQPKPAQKIIKSPKKNKVTSLPNVTNVNVGIVKNKDKKKCKLLRKKHVNLPEKPKEEVRAPPVKVYENKKTSTSSNKSINTTEQKLSIVVPVSPNLETETESPKQETQQSPKQETQQSQTVISDASEPTVEELIRLQEIDKLSDEDLMEILTCPSPVWWEDPPDYSYREGAISMNEDIINHNNNVDKTKTKRSNTNQLKYNNKFIAKRNKLENLLTTIKTKINNTIDSEKIIRRRRKRKINVNNLIKNKDVKESICQEKESDADMIFDLHNDEMLSNLENIKIPIQSDTTNEKERKPVDIDTTTVDGHNLPKYFKQTEKSGCKNEITANEQNKRFKIMSIDSTDASPISIKSNSTEYEVQEDAISDTNIKFIYEDSGSQNSMTFESTDVSEIETDVIDSKSDIERLEIKKADVSTSNNSTQVNKKEMEESQLKAVNINPATDAKPFGVKIQNDKTNISPQKNKKSPKKAKINPKDRKRHEIMTVYKIITTEKYNENEMKSIAAKEKSIDNIEKIINSNYASTSNDNTKLNSMDEVKKVPSESKINPKSSENDKKGGLTKKREDLNKILDILTKSQNDLNKKAAQEQKRNQEKLSRINDKNAKLDSFYKKYKLTFQNKTKETTLDIDKNYIEINYCTKCYPNQQKSIIIGNTKTKYCMKCSGIFETEECSYCSKLAVNSSKLFSCSKCSVHFCCDLALSTHVKGHS